MTRWSTWHRRFPRRSYALASIVAVNSDASKSAAVCVAALPSGLQKGDLEVVRAADKRSYVYFGGYAIKYEYAAATSTSLR